MLMEGLTSHADPSETVRKRKSAGRVAICLTSLSHLHDLRIGSLGRRALRMSMQTGCCPYVMLGIMTTAHPALVRRRRQAVGGDAAAAARQPSQRVSRSPAQPQVSRHVAA